MNPGRRRSSVNEGLEAFSRAYGLTKGVMSDMDDAEVKSLMKEKMDASRAEADASGGPAYTLDAGKDNKAAPDFVYGDKGARDSAAEANNFEKEMATQPYSPEAGMAASGLGAVAAPIASTVPGQTMSRVPQANGLSAITAPRNMSVEPPPATEVAAPKEGYTTGEIATPKLSAADIFHKKYAPSVTAKMIEQGKYKEATAFDEWSRSAKGAAYGDAWIKASMMEHSGDVQGGVSAMVDLYNKQLPDGQYAVVEQGENGELAIRVRNEKTHALIGQAKGTGIDLLQAGMGMLAPKEAFTFQMKAKLTAEKEAAALRLQDKKEAYGLSLQDKKDASAEKRLAANNAAMLEGVDRRVQGGIDAAAVRASKETDLTVPQQRANKEIDAARKALAGMSRDEVLRKTQPATATGRVNREYDPQLAGQWKLANRRKYGDDPQADGFDQQRTQTPIPQNPQKAKHTDITSRMAADPAMKGNRPGRLVPNGIEVIDSSGRVIGHYN